MVVKVQVRKYSRELSTMAIDDVEPAMNMVSVLMSVAIRLTILIFPKVLAIVRGRALLERVVTSPTD